jgi:hypothetical protein
MHKGKRGEKRGKRSGCKGRNEKRKFGVFALASAELSLTETACPGADGGRNRGCLWVSQWSWRDQGLHERGSKTVTSIGRWEKKERSEFDDQFRARHGDKAAGGAVRGASLRSGSDEEEEEDGVPWRE